YPGWHCVAWHVPHRRGIAGSVRREGAVRYEAAENTIKLVVDAALAAFGIDEIVRSLPAVEVEAIAGLARQRLDVRIGRGRRIEVGADRLAIDAAAHADIRIHRPRHRLDQALDLGRALSDLGQHPT